MCTKPSIAILHNQIQQDSPEDVLDILRQAQWVGEILTDKGYQTRLVPFSLHALELIKAEGEMVFNLVDSEPGGENLTYLVPAFLDYYRIAYTGCTFDSLYLSTNKPLSKQSLKSHNLPTPAWIEHTTQDVDDTLYLIKPANQDASVGLDDSCLVPSDRLKEALLAKTRQLGMPCFAEQYIEGREFTVCIYGTMKDIIVLPPYEWVFKEYGDKPKLITYDAKWTENSFGYDHIEAKYTHDAADAGLLEQLQQYAKACWDAFNLSGYARVDYRVDQQNKAYILEVNANPSLYGFYHLAKEWNFSFEDFIEYLVQHPQSS